MQNNTHKNNEYQPSDRLLFPSGFLWGAATSAHQVEGGIKNNWSEWEHANAERLAKEARDKWQTWQQKKFPEMFDPQNYISGRACDHYNRYKEDFNLAKEGGHNAHRFSIEWSRIEPEEGKFDEKEIEHYRKVIMALKERGIEPFVTLWHFTDPIWINQKGGWENKETIKYFVRYAEKIIDCFGGQVKFWLSFNEPATYAGHIHIFSAWLSRKKSIISTDRVIKNICLAHNELHEKIHSKKNNNMQLGIVFNLKHHAAYDPKNILDKLLAKMDEYFRDTRYLELTINHCDFLGLNYYFHDRLKFSIAGNFFGLADIKNPNIEISDLSWDISAEGIYHILKRLKKYNIPIYITENGLADADDSRREKFIKDHLYWVYKAIAEGADVRGYFHWSFMDNFEWDKGFWPRFGLVEVDYSAQGGSASGGKTLERKPRKSFYAYKEIIDNNGI